MELGITIPNLGPLAEPDAIRAIATQSEDLGFRAIAIPDHIVLPKDWEPRYPYSPNGATDLFDNGDCLEPLALMASLASMTEHSRLLTSVMVVPYRQPVLTAKWLATIDVMSKGRVTVGCGTGWMREEFEAVDAAPFDRRGAVTDEYIAAFRELWTNEAPEFDGEFAKFSNIWFRPPPVQKPHPPIWIGGDSPRAMRRTAEIGDGWFPIGVEPGRPLNTVARYGGAVEKIRSLAEAAGRDPADITMAFWAVWYDDTARGVMADDGTRHMLLGEPEEVAADIDALGALGVKSIVFNFQRATLAETLDAQAKFADEVMPLVTG